MGQLDSTCSAPPRAPPAVADAHAHGARRGVAVHVTFGRKGLKPGFSLYRLKGWKPRAFNPRVNCIHIQRLQPRRGEPEPRGVAHLQTRDVALQVAFERQTLKPVFHLIGVRLWV
jgi:hypothetical protein